MIGYRGNLPLAPWITERAKACALAGARLVFDYHAHGTRISTLEAHRGKAGWRAVQLVAVAALGNQEQHLRGAASKFLRPQPLHAVSVGTKRWKYLLAPHDEISESLRLSDFLRFEQKST